MEMILNGLQGFGGGLLDFVLPFLIILSILVFVHEWGHYIVARMCGVKVEEFSVGFGKELFGRYDKNGTRWKFCLIPLGGFVKMYGDADPASAGKDEGAVDPSLKNQAFFAKPVWQRALIVFAGPAINFIFAIILLLGLYVTLGKPVIPPVASAVTIGGAAHQAGILPGDKITNINNRKIHSFSDIQRQVTISLDDVLDITVLREGEEITFEGVVPKIQKLEDRFGFGHSRGLLGIIGPGVAVAQENVIAVNGIQLSQDDFAHGLNAFWDQTTNVTYKMGDTQQTSLIALKRQNNPQFFESGHEREGWLFFDAGGRQILSDPMGPVEAVGQALHETYDVVASTLKALGQMITGQRSARELGGIVRIGAVAGDAAQAGLAAFITFMALLSINLGLINLFPIPMLDGGHLVFYAAEAVRGKPVSEKVQEWGLRFGLVFLIGIMLFANINDLFQIAF